MTAQNIERDNTADENIIKEITTEVSITRRNRKKNKTNKNEESKNNVSDPKDKISEESKSNEVITKEAKPRATRKKKNKQTQTKGSKSEEIKNNKSNPEESKQQENITKANKNKKNSDNKNGNSENKNSEIDNDKALSRKEIKRRLWLQKLARRQRQDKERERWDWLCGAHKQLMKSYINARYSSLESRVYEAVFTKRIRHLGNSPDFFVLSPKNFKEPMRALISAEEAWEHVEMRKCDLKGAVIKQIAGDAHFNILYRFPVPGLSRGFPSLIPSDRIVVNDGSEFFEMVIYDIKGDLMTVRGLRKTFQLAVANRKFDIYFVPSGLNYDRFLRALEEVSNDPRYDEMLFGSDPLIDRRNTAKIDLSRTGTKELDARFDKYNARQKQAIINVMEAKCRPNLYIVFGPPGTGKTYTLVEMVVQICKRDPKAKVLVSSGSNSCVDSIAANIHETRQVKSMIRVSSKFHYYKDKRRPDYYTVEPKDAKRKRVVVTTNMMTPRLERLEFDFILIDEAGHSHVPETLCPITKLAKDGCLVLAGDPKQLGPVIKSFEVERLGLGTSLLERMCNLDMYARDHEDGYNPRFITKLIESYRCDPRILGLCNDLFYHGDLECLGKTPPSFLRMLGYSKPLVFAQVPGVESSPHNSTSRFNKLEARACIKFLFDLYKMGLEPHQVGIITPYLLQRDILQEEYTRQLKQNRNLLDHRYKISPPKRDAEVAGKTEPRSKTHSNALKIDWKGMNTKLESVDMLTAALNMMKLQAETIQAERRVEAERAISKIPPKMDWQCKIDTVDSFQGGEREVILVSTVRSPVAKKIDQCGFLADAKRFNVTISRAKWLVAVFGHKAVLNCCDYWKQYGENATRLKFTTKIS